MSESILSHEEATIARMVREGATIEEIADERNQSVESVEASLDRIEDKTRRALATLEASPFLDEAVAGLSPPRRNQLRERAGPLLSNQ